MDDESAVGRRVTRRALVRTGANVAWMVPAITLVTEAPALAASNNSLSVSGSGGWFLNLVSAAVVGPWTGSFTIKNNSSSLTASGIALVVDFTGLAAPTFQAPSKPSGWSVSPASGQASKFTFTYTGTLAPGASISLASIAFNLPLLASLFVPANAETPGLTASTTTSGISQGTGKAASTN